MYWEFTDVEYDQSANSNVTTETKVLLKPTSRPPGNTTHESNHLTSRPTTIRPIIPTHRCNSGRPTICHEWPRKSSRSAYSSSASNNIPKCGGLRRRPVRFRRAPITLSSTGARVNEHITSGEKRFTLLGGRGEFKGSVHACVPGGCEHGGCGRERWCRSAVVHARHGEGIQLQSIQLTPPGSGVQ